ncbi:MAG TPA: LysR family transcriptional regulator [Candidatus Avilachnospira avicola]|nr:LysR family transcriptional regulator [Candidatus Avilachnospira avicola]
MEQSLSSYKVFYEVAKAGNISKAAKALFISQPAISKSIVKLEEQLGVKLFVRNSRGVSLTAEGEMLLGHVSDAFDNIERGEDEIRRLREFNVGHLRIGSSTTLCKYLLIPYLKEYLKDYPHMKISIHNQDSMRTMKELEDRKLDVGAVVLPSIKSGFRFLKIMEVEDIFVCTPEYLKNLRMLEGEDCNILEKANLMLLDRENITRKHVDEYFRENGIVPRSMLEISTMDLLIDFAKIGLGVSAVIKEFVLSELKEGTLIQIPLKFPVKKRQAGFAYLESNKNEALRRFLQSAG